MRLSTRTSASLALPCAPHPAPTATHAHSPAMLRRHPRTGAAARTGEATTHCYIPTTHTHVAINEGATA